MVFRLSEKDLAKLISFEEAPNSSAVPYLILACGLFEIYPFVTKKDVFLWEAKEWLKFRGSKKAVELAVGWLGFQAEVFEREPGINYYRFAVGLDRKPTKRELQMILKVCDISTPVRSKLTKIFVKGCDRKRLILSGKHAALSYNFLSDDGGNLIDRP